MADGQKSVDYQENSVTGKVQKHLKKITRYCKDIGIKNITFYAFSTENWKRPADEVSAIIELFREYIVDVRNYIGEEVRVLFLGDKTIFDDDLQKKNERS